MMTQTRKVVVLGVALAFVVSGCGSADPADEPLGFAQQRSICGPVDDMQDVELYDGTLGPSVAFVDAHQRPVGMVRWKSDLASRYTNPGNVNGAAWCTATLLSDDTLITAGHCFDPDINGWTWPRDNASGVAISPARGAEEMNVEFDYQYDSTGVLRTISSFSVASLVEYRLGSLDYAVIRVTGSPGTSFGKTTIAPFELSVGDPIAIIQHPAGQPKKVHAGPVVSLSSTAVSYSTADTLGGSSGSGVLNNNTGYLSAVHTNGGCSSGGGSNSGTQVKAIYGASPVVRLLSFDAAKLSVVL